MSLLTTQSMYAPLSPTHIGDDGDGTLVPYTPTIRYARMQKSLPKQASAVNAPKKGSTRVLIAHMLTTTICIMGWYLVYVYIVLVLWVRLQRIVLSMVPEAVSSPDSILDATQGYRQPVWHPSRVCNGAMDFWSETKCLFSSWLYSVILSMRSYFFDKVNHIGAMGLYHRAYSHIGDCMTFAATTAGALP